MTDHPLDMVGVLGSIPSVPTTIGQRLASKCFLSTEYGGTDLDGCWSPIEIYWIPDTGTFLAFRAPVSIWHRRYGEGRTPLDALLSLQRAYS